MKTRNKNHHNFKNEKARKERRKSVKAGLPPGSLVHIGKTLTEKITISVTEYNATGIQRKSINNLSELGAADPALHRWIEIRGLHDTKLIESAGKNLGINMLFLEDIVNTEHRPKFDFQDGMLFLTLKAFSLNNDQTVRIEQISCVLANDFLVTFQESDNPWFDPVRAMLENPSGKIRQTGLDYLLYSLVDLIVDQYYEISETIGDQLEELEDLILESPGRALWEKNRLIKKEINLIRKLLLPALESINKLNRFKPEIIGKEVLRYFNDVDDHLIQVLDYMDSHRDLSAELKENYLSNLNFKMNQVMKLLTIITTIFIPLSFVAGIYGMNFLYMPELQWRYGYFGVLILMLFMIIGMLIYFRKKKWI